MRMNCKVPVFVQKQFKKTEILLKLRWNFIFYFTFSCHQNNWINVHELHKYRSINSSYMYVQKDNKTIKNPLRFISRKPYGCQKMRKSRADILQNLWKTNAFHALYFSGFLEIFQKCKGLKNCLCIVSRE